MLLAACGGDGGGSVAGEDEKNLTPKPGGRLTMAIEAESNGFFPSKEHGRGMIMASIYDTLMAVDHEGNVKPYMADSLKPNADFSAWTLKLRPGIMFHDNTPLNAAALKSNFDDFHKVRGSRTFGTVAVIQSLDIVDDLTATYKLTGPNGAFPSLLAGVLGMPFSPTAVASMGPDKFVSNPVGAGPFVFVSWLRDSQLVVKKNPNYWQQGLPLLDEVVFKPIPDEDARLATLQSGDVDMMQTVRQAQKVRDAAESSDIVYLPDIGNVVADVNLNMARPPTNDIRIRKAMAYAVDQKSLISVQGLEGIAPVTKQLFAKDSPFYSEEAEKAYAHADVAKAKQLVKEYVNDPNRSDGKPVGTPPFVSITCTAGVSSLNDLVLIYKQRWGDVGIEADLDLVDQATLVQKLVGTAPDYKGQYEVSCARNGSDDDPDVFYNSYALVDNASNVLDIDDAEVRRLVEKGRASGDPEVRQKVYQDLMVRINELQPYVFHGGLATALGVRPYVKGLQWEFPGGTKGEGYPSASPRFVEVWLNK